MRCDKAREKMSDYFEGLLIQEEDASVAAHIASCAGCREAYSDLVKTVGHMRGLKELEPPIWLAGKVMAKVKEEASKQGIWKRLFYPLHIKLPLEAVATVLITVTAFYIFRTTEHGNQHAEIGTVEVVTQQMPAEDTMRPKDMGAGGTEDKRGLHESADKPLQFRVSPKARLSGNVSPKEADGLPAMVRPREISPSDTLSAIPAAPEVPGAKSDSLGAGTARPDEFKASDEAMSKRRMAIEPRMAKKESSWAPSPAVQPRKIEADPYLKDLADQRHMTLRLNAPDIEKAYDEVQGMVSRLGGRVVKTESMQGGIIVTVEIEAEGISGLVVKLGALGEVIKKDSPAGENTGKTMVLIEIMKASGR